MAINQKIKLLIVDDSIFFRKALAGALAGDQRVEVVGQAVDALDAMEKIKALNPDVVTLDVEMPKLNGIDFLKKLMPTHPVPVVVVSSAPIRVLDALSAGAVEFIRKPEIKGPEGMKQFMTDLSVKTASPGKFSVYNALTAIAICRHFGVKEEDIRNALRGAKVKGRIEMVKVSDDFTLMIDYAHNAMALESLLATLREYRPNRLVCLFGCGGNRSKLRRYEMGEVSGRLADFTIITSDNPRFEDPQDIIEDIKTGIGKTNGRYIEICDRREAVRYAITHGQKGDIIVLAGKGHEDYQEIKGVKYPMDERVMIQDILKELDSDK